MTGLAQLTIANAKEFFRVRQEVILALALPVFLMVILGVVLSNVPGIGNVTNEGLVLKVGVVATGGPLDAALASALEADSTLAVLQVTASEGAAQLESAELAALLEFPSNADLPVRLSYNSTRTAHSRTVLNRLYEITATLNGQLAERPLPLTIETTAVGGEDDFTNFVDFLVPGIVAMAVFPGVVFSLTPTLVTHRERGVLRRLKLTPVSMPTYALSHVLFRIALGIAQMALVLITAALVFRRPFSYQPGALLLLCVAGSVSGSAVAFLLSTIARSQAAGVTLAQITMLPMLIMCGAFFPLELMPAEALPVINLLPLTPLTAGFREVMNFARPVSALLPGIGLLLAYTAGCAALASRFFRWDTN